MTCTVVTSPSTTDFFMRIVGGTSGIQLSDMVSECIGVLRHMQRYFSYICDDTDVHAD